VSDNPGCLGFLARLFGERPKETGELPYRLRDDFLSPAELSFYRVLSTTVAARAAVLTKVRLADLFFVPRSEGAASSRNRIAQKHLDFLLCDPETMRPLVGVELDDRSHERSSRQARDGFVDEVFRVAGLPLIHVPVRPAYSVAELSGVLSPYLGGGDGVRPDTNVEAPVRSGSETAAAGTAPMCPKCGVPMVLRTAGRGERRGERFYGCPNYPNCRETLPPPEGGPA
jgi:hypothetical protein